jgi:hypothetical protein
MQVEIRLSSINSNRPPSKRIILPSNIELFNKDTIFSKMFPYEAVPHHVWIDQAGKILAITSGYNATSENLKKILDGEEVKLARKKEVGQYNLYDSGWMKPRNEILNYPVFYSAFMGYQPGIGVGQRSTIDTVLNRFRVIFWNSDIQNLYRSCLDVPYGRLIFECRNSLDFQRPSRIELYDQWREKFSFGYEMWLPETDLKLAKVCMLNDLNRFFTIQFGITGQIEKRVLPAFVLKLKNSKLLQSITGETKYQELEGKTIFRSYPFSSIIIKLKTLFEDMKMPVVFIDETGIGPKLKVDMDINGELKDIENLKKELIRYGLKIVEEEREVEVIVISDKK